MNTANIVYYIGNFDKPELNAAGKRVYGNALVFEQLGYKVVLIGKSCKADHESIPEQYSRSILFYYFPKFNLANTSEYVKYFKKIVDKEGKPDVVVRYGSPGLALFDRALIKCCKNLSCPIIADVVDWLPSGGSNIAFNVIKAIDTYLEKAIYNKKSSGIIAISSFLSDYYKRQGCKNVIVLPPLVEKYLKNTNQSSGKIVNIVYAGLPFRLGRKVSSSKEVKDRLDLAIQGLAGMSDKKLTISFDIYGITEEDYLIAYPEHRSLVVDNRDRIVFHGKQPMNEIQNAVNKADLTILLRDVTRATSAGFPTKIVESLSCGTPVITTDTSDLAKYISHGNNGFFIDIKKRESLSVQLEKAISFYVEHKDEIKENCYLNQDFVPDKYKSILTDFISGIRGAQDD